MISDKTSGASIKRQLSSDEIYQPDHTIERQHINWTTTDPTSGWSIPSPDYTVIPPAEDTAEADIGVEYLATQDNASLSPPRKQWQLSLKQRQVMITCLKKSQRPRRSSAPRRASASRRR